MDKWLRNTNVVKVIALFLGILLWAVVHLDQKSTTGGGFSTIRERQINNVGITPLYDENKFHIVSIDPEQVTIRVEGKESVLNKISTSQYQIELDLKNAKKGENILPLEARNFPSGVSVTIIPSSARVVLDEKQAKEVPVQINVVGNPASGYKAGQPVVKPVRVLVTLPSGMIEDTIHVQGEVNIENAQAAVNKQVKLVATDKDGKELDVSIKPPIVDVEVPITQPFKKMPLQLKVTGAPPAGYSVSLFQPSMDQITVYGPQDLLNKMDFYEGPQVDLNGVMNNKEVVLDIPLMDRVASLDPAKVDVKIEVVPSSQKTLQQIPITIIGQNNDFDTKITTPGNGTMDVTVEAAPLVIGKLKSQDVQAIVDVSNLPPGTHTLPVTINLPQFVKKVDTTVQAVIDIAAKTTAPPVTTGEPTGTRQTR